MQTIVQISTGILYVKSMNIHLEYQMYIQQMNFADVIARKIEHQMSFIQQINFAQITNFFWVWFAKDAELS